MSTNSINIFPFDLPLLTDGTYSIQVNQQVSQGTHIYEKSEDHSLKIDFEVAGEQVSLKPADFYALYPPAGSNGRYANMLPMAVLNRSTLPWERKAIAQADSVYPWLALIWISEEEQKQYFPIVQSRKWDKDLGKSLNLPQDPGEKFSVLAAPYFLLKDKLPNAEELKLFCHVRENQESKKKQAVVLGKAISNTKNQFIDLYLVSVEHRYQGSSFSVQENLWQATIQAQHALSWASAGLQEARNIALSAAGIPWIVLPDDTIYYQGPNKSWTRAAQGLALEIASGADGSIFVIGIDNYIYRWENNNWTKYDATQKAEKIAVDQHGTPWVILNHSVYFQKADKSWEKVATGVASEIAIGADGSVFILGKFFEGVYQLKAKAPIETSPPAPSWKGLPGINGAEKISVDKDGKPWVVKKGQMYYLDGSNWKEVPGDGLFHEIAINGDHILSLRHTPLVCLKKWRFFDEEKGLSFIEKAKKLSYGYLAKPGPKEASPYRMEAERFLDSGFVPLTHTMRAGTQAVSWYRSPLLPGPPPPPTAHDVAVPVSAADALIRYDSAYGMFDVSYAAAWELGRLLALNSKDFSTGLYLWKRQHTQSWRKLEQQELFTHLPDAHPSYAPPQLPKELDGWLAALSRLEGVPFNYLVPDESMLPAADEGTIRSFYLDPLWITYLLDGAFSIGRVGHADTQMATSLIRQSAVMRNIQNHFPVTGYLMRSELVAGYPGLIVDAYKGSGDSSQQLPIHSEKNHGKNIKLGLFKGELDHLSLYIKADDMHFSIENARPGTPKDATDFAQKHLQMIEKVTFTWDSYARAPQAPSPSITSHSYSLVPDLNSTGFPPQLFLSWSVEHADYCKVNGINGRLAPHSQSQYSIPFAAIPQSGLSLEAIGPGGTTQISLFSIPSINTPVINSFSAVLSLDQHGKNPTIKLQWDISNAQYCVIESAYFSMPIQGKNGSASYLFSPEKITGSTFKITAVAGNQHVSQATQYILYKDARDPQQSRTYKTIFLAGKLWFAESDRFKPTTGLSLAYHNDEKNATRNGRLYDHPTALKIAPAGWKLPLAKDWKALVEAFQPEPDGNRFRKAFEALKENGSSGFEVNLGGVYRGNDEGFVFPDNGIFWAEDFSTMKPEMVNTQGFSPQGLGSTGFCFDDEEYPNYAMYVRYILAQ